MLVRGSHLCRGNEGLRGGEKKKNREYDTYANPTVNCVVADEVLGMSYTYIV